MVQHYSQVNFDIVEEKMYKVVEKCKKCVPLVRKKAQETARRKGVEETNSTIYLDVCAVVQTIFSVVWGQNQNRIKTNKKPPNPKKAARRNERSLTEHTDPDRGDKGSTVVFNAHLTVLPTSVFSYVFTY